MQMGDGRRQVARASSRAHRPTARKPSTDTPPWPAFEQPRGDARLDAGIADRDVRADVVQNAAQQSRDFGREHVAHPEVLDSDVL
jgi:hypothetical protein